MPCCAVLCCAVLCCAVLCCAVLCSAVLCCAVLCCPSPDFFLKYPLGRYVLSVRNLFVGTYLPTQRTPPATMPGHISEGLRGRISVRAQRFRRYIFLPLDEMRRDFEPTRPMLPPCTRPRNTRRGVQDFRCPVPQSFVVRQNYNWPQPDPPHHFSRAEMIA